MTAIDQSKVAGYESIKAVADWVRAKINANTIDTDHLQNSAVTNAKIASEAVTPDKMSPWSESGNRWGVMTKVDASGEMDVGKVLKFHYTDDDTSSGNAIEYTTGGLKFLQTARGYNGGAIPTTLMVPDASASTLQGIIGYLRKTNGAMGSVQLATAYTVSTGITMSAGWYNYLYIPHRDGGINGQTQGDNTTFGTLFMVRMNADDVKMWRVRVYSGSNDNPAAVDRVSFITNNATVEAHSDYNSSEQTYTASSTTLKSLSITPTKSGRIAIFVSVVAKCSGGTGYLDLTVDGTRKHRMALKDAAYYTIADFTVADTTPNNAHTVAAVLTKNNATSISVQSYTGITLRAFELG